MIDNTNRVRFVGGFSHPLYDMLHGYLLELVGINTASNDQLMLCSVCIVGCSEVFRVESDYLTFIDKSPVPAVYTRYGREIADKWLFDEFRRTFYKEEFFAAPRKPRIRIPSGKIEPDKDELTKFREFIYAK